MQVMYGERSRQRGLSVCKLCMGREVDKQVYLYESYVWEEK